MNISMTWATYALIVSVCLGVYYLVIILFIRRLKAKAPSIKAESNDFLEASPTFAEPKTFANANTNLFGEPFEEELESENEMVSLSPYTQDFADEVQAFTSSSDESITKEELTHAIQRIILKYPSLKESQYKYELTQLIAISTENYCSIHFSAEELSELWKC